MSLPPVAVILRLLLALFTLGTGGQLRSTATTTDAAAPCTMRTLIVSAYPAEADAVLKNVTLDKQPVLYGKSHPFYVGTIAKKPVLTAMSGIGLVNATNLTEDALNLTCATNHTFVGAVLFSGVAGGEGRMQIADVAVPKRWTLDDGKTWHEVDPALLRAAAPLAAAKAPTLESTNSAGDPGCTGTDPQMIPIVDLQRMPKVFLNGDGYSSDALGGQAGDCIVGGGDTFGCSPCRAPGGGETAGAATATSAVAWLQQSVSSGGSEPGSGHVYDAIDEETAAVQTVADKHRVAFLGFRGISDGPGDPLHLPGFPFQFFVYKQIAADNVATTVANFMAIWDGNVGPSSPVTDAGTTPSSEPIVPVHRVSATPVTDLLDPAAADEPGTDDTTPSPSVDEPGQAALPAAPTTSTPGDHDATAKQAAAAGISAAILVLAAVVRRRRQHSLT